MELFQNKALEAQRQCLQKSTGRAFSMVYICEK